MRRAATYRGTFIVLFTVAVVFASLSPTRSYALISDGANALDLVGQFDETSFTAPVPVYTKSGLNNAANKFGFNTPSGIKIDLVNNRLFVADTNNNRILVYNLNNNGTLPDRVPDSVLGQTTFWGNTASTTAGGFNTPIDVSVDTTAANSRMFVSDSGNNRVLVYDYGISTQQNAFDALGQYNRTTDDTDPVPLYTKGSVNDGPNKFGFNAPTWIEFDNPNDRLFVTDSTNNRILVFQMNSNGTFVDRFPDNVLGQPTFFANTAATQQNGLNVPTGIAYDSANNRLFVGQSTSNNVTVYDVTAITDGENATNVLGQPNFLRATAATTQNGLNVPQGLAYDSGNNRLFVSQSTANRVTVYDVTAITNGENATNVLGQTSYTVPTAATTQPGMNGPYGLAYDSNNNRLFVAQSNASRVTVYDIAAITDGENATNVLGQPNYTASAAVYTQNGMNGPQGLAYDSANNRLFVGQSQSTRVTAYDVAAITDGENATNVLGLPNYGVGIAIGTTQSSVFAYGLTYDSGNNRLFVAQSTANRVTVYDVTAITDGENAVDLLGQYDSTSTIPLYTKSFTNDGGKFGLDAPKYLAYDNTRNRLFVTDYTNNRVLVFQMNSNGTFVDRIPDNVLGRASFFDQSTNAGQNGLRQPSGLAYDSVNNRLFVGDTLYPRVMVFDVAAITDGENATNILGQVNYLAGVSGVAQNHIYPSHLAYDSVNNRLFVGDTVSSPRVMVFDVAAITDGENATNVLGQPNFDASNSVTQQNGMSGPQGLAYDSTNNRLFVVDAGGLSGRRVLVYDVAAITNGENATNVLGQPNFISSINGLTQNGLRTPVGVAYSNSMGQRLFVTSSGISRVTVYDVTAITNGENATNVLGQPSYTAQGANTQQNGLSGPTSLVYDNTNDRLFVADTTNNRVMVYDFGTSTGKNAVYVLGQPNFLSNAAATTQNGMNAPQYIVRTGAKLLVAQSTANRLTIYSTTTITSGQNATNVLGQPDYASAATATTQNGMNAPRGVTYDSTNGRLFVADNQNNRVLAYDIAAITDGENATNVLGQPDYTANAAAATQNGMNAPFGLDYNSSNNRLFVSENSNNRVTAYDVTAITDGENATNVLGQPNFTSTAAAATQNGLSAPRGLAVSGSTLFVADTGNHRVLFYDVSSITNGQNATNLIGQNDETSFTAPVPIYTKSGVNNGPNKFGFSGSTFLSIDGTNNRMFISDSTNNRVLVYALSATNTFSDRVPDNVLGQPNYYANTAATTQNGMNGPRGMNFDSANNRLFVACNGNNRITVYDVAAITNGENATNVLGQPDYASAAAATTQNGMNTPRGVAYDSTNNKLFVADNQNNRVLAYDIAAITDGENATNVLGQANYSTSDSGLTQAGMNGPQGLAYDGARTKLFVAENGNNRVTAYDVAAITDGENATNVLGQADYGTSNASDSSAGVNDPRGLAYDATNTRLFVASFGNNRVTVFSTSTITDGENADNIIGQPTYSGTATASTQNGLSGPVGLAFEGTNRRLFVTDSVNNRMAIFDGSGSSTSGASASITSQALFFFFGF